MPGRQRRQPPADEPGARAEREVATLAGLDEEAVEPVERGRRRLGRIDEALPCPVRAQPRVVADDGQPVAFGAADPLAGGLRDRLEDRRLVGRRGPAGGAGFAERAPDPVERQCHPVPRWLDLLDRTEAGRQDRRPVGGLRRPAPPDRPPPRPRRHRPAPGSPRSDARRGPRASRPHGPGPGRAGGTRRCPVTHGHRRVSASTRPPSSVTRKRGDQPDARRCSAQAIDW